MAIRLTLLPTTTIVNTSTGIIILLSYCYYSFFCVVLRCTINRSIGSINSSIVVVVHAVNKITLNTKSID